MVNQISVSSIKIIEEFRVISSTSPGELEVGVKVLSEKLNERPSFDCDPITCWKSPSDEIFLIGGSYVLDSYKQSNREKIPVILNDCNGAKNFPQVRSWMFINVDAELYTPLSTKDKKSAFCEFALLPENLNKTYQEISSELDIPLGTIKNLELEVNNEPFFKIII